MPESGKNILLSVQERRVVDYIREMCSASKEMRDSLLGPDGTGTIKEVPQSFIDKINEIDAAICKEFDIDPEDNSADLKMFIETVNLFHRVTPKDTVEGFWRANFSTQGAMMALMTGSLSPLVLNESMFRLISRLKIDQDGWVEGIDE